ncbi:MAG: TauD/TfdA dioxygenase family protein [Burkholderiaceae bacterium]
MEVIPMDAGLGCEVRDVDLSRPLAQQQIDALRQAFVDHGVMVVRGQQLDEAQMVAFSRYFGPEESYQSTLSQYLRPGFPQIQVLSNIVENGRPLGVRDAGQYWHTDRSYVTHPAWSSILYSLRIPRDDTGRPLGDTVFSNMVAAYHALPAERQAQLSKLSAWHEYVFRFSEKNDSLPGLAQPIVIAHPITGKPCLYVNKGFTRHIVGMSEADSEQLLEELYAHVARDEFLYRHHWREGDVLMWDNFSTQHCAISDYGPETPRLMWRTVVKGFPVKGFATDRETRQ